MYEVLVIGNPSFCEVSFSPGSQSRLNYGPSAFSLRTLQQLGGTRLASVGAIADDCKSEYASFVDDLGDAEFLALGSDTTGGFELELMPNGDVSASRCIGVAKNIGVRDVPEEYLASEAIILSPALQEIDSEFIQWLCDSSDARILMDPQLYGVGRSQKPEPLPTIDSLDKTQCYLDFIQVNVDEARHFLGEDDPYVQVELVVEAFAETCILTLGPHGALIFDGHRFHRVPAYEVMAVDTYGAGSVHLAAFAAGLIQGRSAVESAAVASAAASISVEQSGPMFRIETHEMKRRADEVLDGVVTS